MERGSSAGSEAVEQAAAAGLFLDEWQKWVLLESLGERADGSWSAFEVGILVSRQNGKGAILEARELAGLFVLKESLVVHTAHEFKTCYEHFLRIVNLIESTPDLDSKVMRIRRGAGEQAIELKTGQRLRFIARSGASGRGMSGECVILDEAFALTASMMGALLPTLSARENPQVWYTSSAPHLSSDVLHALRTRAIGGTSTRLFFAEWGNEPDVDPNDLDAWYRANPALGIRITEEFVANEREAMRDIPAEFSRERLGVPDNPDDGTHSPIDPLQWASLVEAGSRIESHRQWSVAVSVDRRWSTIGVAGRRADGRLHVEWMDRRPGTGWVVDAVAAGWASTHVPIRIHKTGPENGFIAPLRERGVEVVEVSSAEVAQATAQLIDAVADGSLRHLGQGSLDVAVRGAVLRVQTDGAALWSQRNSNVEITPLMACTVAAGGVPVQVPMPAIF